MKGRLDLRPWCEEVKEKTDAVSHNASKRQGYGQYGPFFGPPGIGIWWSRRESNPRPQALYRQFYILSPVFLCFKLDHARRTGWILPSRLGFSTHPSDPDERDFMKINSLPV